LSVIDDSVLRTLEHHLNHGVTPTLVVEHGVVTWASDSVEGLLGASAQDVRGQALASALAGCVPGMRRDPVQVQLHASRRVSTEVTIQGISGEVALEVSSAPVPGSAGCWVLTLAKAQDARSLAGALRIANERFDALSARAPIAIFSSEAGLRLGHVNDAFCEVFAATSEELLGTNWLGRLSPEAASSAVQALGAVLMEKCEQEWVMEVERPDGSVRTVIGRAAPVDDSTRAAAFVGTLEDVTERRAHEVQLEFAAKHDALTGLLNRSEMKAVLERMLSSARAGEVGVMFLDLDEFKTVNDTLGHTKGDELLVAVARRVQEAAGPGDLVARFGGDEFVVARAGASRSELEGLAQGLVEAVRSVVRDLGLDALVSTSVGVVVSKPGASAEDLVREADVAMYQAKGAGKDCWRFLDEEAQAVDVDTADLRKDLRVALETGTIEVHYQPVTTIEDDELVAVEALARWDHPTRGNVSPEVFVELAEATGMVNVLGELVLERACAALTHLKASLGSAAPRAVSVNVSARQLSDPGLVPMVGAALARHGLAGDELCLEITESAVMEDPARALEALAALRGLGVKLALDDFGTGHSSLSYLRDLPVTVVKLDRSFIERLGTRGGAASERDTAVVQAVLGLSRSLNLRVVAEGVETGDQLSVLAGLDALARIGEGLLGEEHLPLLVQGWLRAKAMDAADLACWVQERAAVPA
jgi:diguanylate cyclase (GGDEF)-like protein/PAS domain S-box-containing protein